jgi:hypothetical protein
MNKTAESQKRQFCILVFWHGGVAQLGERLLCKQEVDGSIPFTSTTFVGRPAEARQDAVGQTVLPNRERSSNGERGSGIC